MCLYNIKSENLVWKKNMLPPLLETWIGLREREKCLHGALVKSLYIVRLRSSKTSQSLKLKNSQHPANLTPQSLSALLHKLIQVLVFRNQSTRSLRLQGSLAQIYNMADVKLYFTFRHFVEDPKDQAAESSVGELYTWERLLPIMLSTTFLFLVVFLMVGLGIMLKAYRTLDSEPVFSSCQSTKLPASETLLLHQHDSETGFSSSQSTMLPASETLLFHKYDSETSFSSCQSAKLLVSDTLLFHKYDSDTSFSSC